MIRQLALGAVVFVAALVLLAGITAIVGAPGTGEGSPTPAAAVTSPTLGGSTGPSSSAATSTGTARPSGSGQAIGSGRPSGPPAASGTVTASPSSGANAVLVGAGDIGDCSRKGDAATADLLETVAGTVFAAGDLAYESGSPKQFQDCYGPTWGRVLDRTIAVPGNHDWLDKDLGGYLGYLGSHGAQDGRTWYSTDLGSWHVVMLDSECHKIGGCGADSPEGRWLRDDLAASTAACTLAIWHKPRWSSGEHGNDDDVAPFWQILHDAGADVVVNGHDHDYERFAPQDPAGHEDRTRGIREFVVGTGGAELRDFGRTAANSEFRLAGVYGVLELTLKAGGYDWRYLPASGDVTDAGSGPCH